MKPWTPWSEGVNDFMEHFHSKREQKSWAMFNSEGWPFQGWNFRPLGRSLKVLSIGRYQGTAMSFGGGGDNNVMVLQPHWPMELVTAAAMLASSDGHSEHTTICGHDGWWGQGGGPGNMWKLSSHPHEAAFWPTSGKIGLKRHLLNFELHRAKKITR